jgi:hypothetical protein
MAKRPKMASKTPFDDIIQKKVQSLKSDRAKSKDEPEALDIDAELLRVVIPTALTEAGDINPEFVSGLRTKLYQTAFRTAIHAEALLSSISEELEKAKLPLEKKMQLAKSVTAIFGQVTRAIQLIADDEAVDPRAKMLKTLKTLQLHLQGVRDGPQSDDAKPLPKPSDAVASVQGREGESPA